jgi:small-conductance mechanosensitive channel
MLQKPSLWCNGILVLCALSCAAAAAPSRAADAPTSAAGVALPESLTRESARELLSRLSDEQVRSLLLEQLDRAAVARPVAGAAATASMSGMAGMVEQHAVTMRERLHAMRDALARLPQTVRDIGAKLGSPDGSSALARLAGSFAAMLVVGWLAQWLYDYALRNQRSRLLHAEAGTFSARAFARGAALLLDLGGLVVFALAALAVFFVFWMGHELRRVAILEALLAVVVIRLTALLARFLLAPAGVRLLPFADVPARRLRAFAIAVAAIFAVGTAIASVLTTSGASEATIDLLRIASWVAGLVIVVATVWLLRRPIADLIRGDAAPGTVVSWLADLWPVAAIAYFLALFVGSVSNILAGTPRPTGVGLASVVVVVALPIVDMLLCAALAAAAARGRGVDGAAVPGWLAAYEPIFRHAIHIVVIVIGLLVIGQLWQLDLFALAQKSLGGRIASSLLGIGIVLLAAYMLWEIAKAAIDRRLQAEGQRSDDVPATRLRTLLPILRATILITIVVMAAMSVLAALGVDILPLLAGASVVGVAIGFGSQTLVRDIVSGAFFLMDDAFRLGEYIEVGDAKGRVEKINVRSVFLRHHRGALNILPYGEIKRLRNTSRDWSIHVMEFRLTYDTNMLQVKKIMKKIGEELAADADYAADILQPLKSAGVLATEDSAIVVRAKFTARPTNNAWVVRRVAYDKIIRAFRDAGIKFAHRQVTVNVPPTAEGGALAGPAAAAAAATETKSASRATS